MKIKCFVCFVVSFVTPSDKKDNKNFCAAHVKRGFAKPFSINYIPLGLIAAAVTTFIVLAIYPQILIITRSQFFFVWAFFVLGKLRMGGFELICMELG